MSLTAETSHVEMWPYVSAAASASDSHASTAVSRSDFDAKVWAALGDELGLKDGLEDGAEEGVRQLDEKVMPQLVTEQPLRYPTA